VPALCMWYVSPVAASTRWTWATSVETEAVGVPRGMRQKSVARRRVSLSMDVHGRDLPTQYRHDGNPNPSVMAGMVTDLLNTMVAWGSGRARRRSRCCSLWYSSVVLALAQCLYKANPGESGCNSNGPISRVMRESCLDVQACWG